MIRARISGVTPAGVDAEDLGCHLVVEVSPRAEGFDESLVSACVCHEAHLDLRVVGAHEILEAVPGNECAADLPAQFRADRDVLQVGIDGREPAGGRHRLDVGGVDAPVRSHGGEQPIDGLSEPDRVPVRQQVSEEGVLRLGEQPLQRFSVGRVARFRASRLRHPQFIEQYGLQLLRRPEVHLVTQHFPGCLLRRGHGRVELTTEVLQPVDVDGDPELLHRCECALQGKLYLPEKVIGLTFYEFDAEGRCEVEYGSGVEQGDTDGLVVVPGNVEGELRCVPLIGLFSEFALQVSQHQISQVIGALVGAQEVRRQQGVEFDSCEVPAPGPARQCRALRLVHHLAWRRVLEPCGQRCIVVRGECGNVDPGTRTVGACQGNTGEIPSTRAPRAHEVHPCQVLGVGIQPGADIPGVQGRPLHGKGAGGNGFLG